MPVVVLMLLLLVVVVVETPPASRTTSGGESWSRWYVCFLKSFPYQTAPYQTLKKKSMDTDADGYSRLTLGDGERELPMDDDVRRLCLAMHRALCPLSPHDVYDCVTSGRRPDVAQPREAYRVLAERTHDFDECDSVPHSLCDVAQCVIAEFWCGERSETFGHPRTVLRFDTPQQVAEARRLDDEYNCGTSQDVLRLLSHSQNRDSLQHVFGVVGIREAWHDDCDEYVTTQMWTDMCRATTDVCTSLPLCVVHRSASVVFPMTFVHHHWVVSDHDPTCMHHRSLRRQGWNLRYVRCALHGGHVELEVVDDDDEWPLWISETCHRATRIPRSAVVQLELPLHRYSTTVAKRRVDIDTIDCDVKCRKVIAKWSKSQSAAGVNAPFLVRVRALLDDGSFHAGGGLTMRREVSEAEVRQSSMLVFADRFGQRYAEGVVERCCDDDACAIYAVYDGERLVGAFAIVIYESVTSNGCSSVCAMVDSFAVMTSESGKGYGGRMFHDGVRRVARRHAGTAAYTVFAQCVRTGDAYRFWFDKLDDSSVARSIVLQALNLDGTRVPVQSEQQCAPRSREYCT